MGLSGLFNLHWDEAAMSYLITDSERVMLFSLITWRINRFLYYEGYGFKWETSETTGTIYSYVNHRETMKKNKEPFFKIHKLNPAESLQSDPSVINLTPSGRGSHHLISSC